MTQTKISNLIALGEGFTTEFKESSASKLGRELCAFANATGGKILIGVTDSGEIVGVNDHNALKSKVQDVARSANPPIAVEIESIEDVLVVTVPEQHSKPYSFGGKFYLREGASSQQMSREEIREFFFREGLIHFDETPCTDYDLRQDLTPEIWNKFVRRAGIPGEMEAETTLRNFHLIKDNKMTHARAWLLCEEITKYTLRAGVTCVLFKGKTNVHILDRRDFTQDLYTIYENCMEYLQTRLNTELIPHARGRYERLELPEEALREAMVNAIVHRDYRSTANVQLHIYGDRVEIIAPGGLPAGMSESELGTRSVPRNPLLFGLFYRMNLVEQIGSGIQRIRYICEEYGVNQPIFKTSENWFTVVFPRSKQSLIEGSEGSAIETEILDTPQDTPQDTPHVTPHVLNLLKVLQGEMSRDEILKKLGLNDRKHVSQEYLKPALEKGLVEMAIPEKPRSKNQKYRLTSKGQQVLENQGRS